MTKMEVDNKENVDEQLAEDIENLDVKEENGGPHVEEGPEDDDSKYGEEGRGSRDRPLLNFTNLFN